MSKRDLLQTTTPVTLKQACANTVYKGRVEGWTVMLWSYLLLILPATLIAIINFYTSDFNISQTEVAIEILILVVGSILFVVALYIIFWRSCSHSSSK